MLSVIRAAPLLAAHYFAPVYRVPGILWVGGKQSENMKKCAGRVHSSTCYPSSRYFFCFEAMVSSLQDKKVREISQCFIYNGLNESNYVEA